jgi:hypothetical protein
LDTVNFLKSKGLATKGKSTPAVYREAYEKGLITRAELFMAEVDRLRFKNPRWKKMAAAEQAETNIRRALKGAIGKGWY